LVTVTLFSDQVATESGPSRPFALTAEFAAGVVGALLLDRLGLAGVDVLVAGADDTGGADEEPGRGAATGGLGAVPRSPVDRTAPTLTTTTTATANAAAIG
jgi:hypothetical protein